jgi:hypothetical protein
VKKYFLYVIAVLGSVTASGQNVRITNQNVFDLRPDRDQLTAASGVIRIRASFWLDAGYTVPFDIADSLPINLQIRSNFDDFLLHVVPDVTNAAPNTVWWTLPPLTPDSYNARAEATYITGGSNNTLEIFNRNIIVTGATETVSFNGASFQFNNSILDVDGNGDLQGIGTNGYRSIVPAESGVADLGRTNAQWRNGYFAEVLVDNISLPPIPRAGASTEKVTLIFDGATTQYFWGGIGFPVPTFEGTNIYTYTNLYAAGNPLLHIASSTQMAVHAWGAAGGGGQVVIGGAGGYVFAILSTIPGTVYEVIVGSGGIYNVTLNSVTAGASPGGGDGYHGSSGNNGRNGSGGGYSGLLINGTTNYVVVAGAGGGGAGSVNGSNGGGLTGASGTVVGSNTVFGTGASSDNFYGLNAVGGTNTTGFGSGGFLQGGHAQANAFGSNLSGGLGGGGAGWFGGAAGGVTAATSTGSASGGGGISYANPDYVTFAYSVRSSTSGTAPVTDLPIYVAGRANGVSSANGQPGLVVIIE